MGALKNNLLVSVLRGDIERFLNTNTELMFNERDLQVRVATWLRDSGHYDKVDMEYAVPKEELEVRGLELKTPSFPWNNDMSIDVVVERLGEFAAVELKYATRPVDVKIDRFGEPLRTHCLIVKNQAAIDLIMYNYWKDVRRVEALAQCYPAVKGGVALIVTNSATYWREPRPGSGYRAFPYTRATPVVPACCNGTRTLRKASAARIPTLNCGVLTPAVGLIRPSTPVPP